LNLGHHIEKPGTDCLSHGMAFLNVNYCRWKSVFEKLINGSNMTACRSINYVFILGMKLHFM
jgi:hypothetical protein